MKNKFKITNLSNRVGEISIVHVQCNIKWLLSVSCFFCEKVLITILCTMYVLDDKFSITFHVVKRLAKSMEQVRLGISSNSCLKKLNRRIANLVTSLVVLVEEYYHTVHLWKLVFWIPQPRFFWCCISYDRDALKPVLIFLYRLILYFLCLSIFEKSMLSMKRGKFVTYCCIIIICGGQFSWFVHFLQVRVDVIS